MGEDGEGQVYQYDAQANTNAVLNGSSGTIEVRFKYQAFGTVVSAELGTDGWTSPPVDLPEDLTPGGMIGMAAQKQYFLDQETNLLLLGAGNNGRYYDPATTRFLSEDPIRKAGGENLQRDVRNNPVNALGMMVPQWRPGSDLMHCWSGGSPYAGDSYRSRLDAFCIAFSISGPGRLLRQRGDGTFLGNLRGGVASSAVRPPVRVSGAGSVRDVQAHRDVLQ